MKKILSLLSLLMLCVVGMNAQTTIYSWESPEGTVIETGGTIAYVNGDGDRLNYQNNGNYTICLNGKKANIDDETPSANAGRMVITLDNELAAGDVISITAYITKNESKKSSAYFYFEKGGEIESAAFSDEANIDAAFNGSPQTVNVNVPDDADGSKTITMTRGQTGTNLFITKLVITGDRTTTKTIGLVPGPWAADGAIFAAYAWNDDGSAWFPFVEVSGAYGTQIPVVYTGINLVRLKPSTAEGFSAENFGLNWNNKWNQTSDIDFTTVADQTIFTITGWGSGDDCPYTAATAVETAKAALQQFLNVAKGLGLDTTNAEALLANDEATAEDVYAALQTLLDSLQQKAAEVVAAAKAFFNQFDAEAAAALKPYFDAADEALAGTDYDAMRTTTTALAMQCLAEGKNAMAKVGYYLMKLENETINADLAALKTAIESLSNPDDILKLIPVIQKLKDDMTPAVQTYLGEVGTLISKGAAAGKDVSAVQTAYTSLLTAAVKSDATIVDLGFALYNLIKAVEEFKAAVELIPDGVYYVMSANAGKLINAEGALDAKGAPITFTFDKASLAYTIAGADFFSGKQWTVANAIEGMSGYYTISTSEGFLATSETNTLEQIADGTADAAIWIVLQKDYWEDIVNSTYTVAGTANLTGSDWTVDEANQMKYNENTKLFEITYKNIIVNNDTKPEFKVVKTNMESVQTWYPEGDGSTNWVITPETLSGEGEYDITITFDPSDAKEIAVSGLKIEDIVINPENGADIFEALIAAEMNKKPRNITINLTEGATYTVSGPLTVYGNFEIQGNGATIDASNLSNNLIQMNTAEAPAEWTAIEFVSIHKATVKGLQKALFYSGCKNYDINWLTIDNCNIELAADATTVDFTKGSVARNFNVENSTIYAPTATTKAFYSSQSGQKATEADANATQTFTFKSSTFYNLAPTKNFFSHRQSNQTWLAYDVENNIFVNCGKSGQVIKGMNGGQSGKNPVWTVKGNAFNFDGADTSAAEATGDEDEPVQESVAGVVIFTDAAAGDFNGVFHLAYGVSAPEKLGDSDWTLAFKEMSELMHQAETLAADKDAVAVGKLIAAIDEAKATGDESNLQAAIDQFTEDNKDQEKDETAKVATNGWKKFDGSNAGVCATQFAPAITTYDGRTAQLAEVFEGNGDRTGTIIYQDITGLENGTYKVGFYGNAFSTSTRDGFECTMEDGATDVAYVFANEEKEYISARIATSTTENDFRQFDVEVTDGNIKLGMGKDTEKSTNWHTMQIYQLTWFTTAKEVFAQDQEELKAVIAEAKALLADETKTEGKEVLEFFVYAAEQAVDSKMINISELEAVIGNLKDLIAGFKKANWYIDLTAGDYYIIDVESGLKMAAGHDWGTRGIVNEAGLDLTLTPYSESRTVTIDSRVYNGDTSHFLGENLYMDSSEWGWALEYQGFGFYILEPNGGKYINIDKDNNLVLSDTPREFIIVTKDGVRAQLLEELSVATKDAPVDATGLIVAQNFNRNDARNAEAWQWTPSETAEENPDNWNNHNFSGGNQVNNCAESYHAAFNVMQTISGAPAGFYQLTAQGFYRQDDFEGEAPAAPVFFANEVNADVPAKAGSENSMSDASASFTNGLYTIEPINFEVKDDGMMYIGITASTNTQWVIWDNFQLKYFGVENPTTGISNVVVETVNDGAIYNLNGQKVQNPKKGLYIINGRKQVVK